MNCIYCNLLCKSKPSKKQHEIRCKSNPNKLISWNKGLTKETSASIQKISNQLTGKKRPEISGNKHYFFNKKWGSSLTGHTTETKQHLSSVAKERNFGGYQPGSGRGKKGWYKGFFCDSSWELAYVVYCLDHNIDIKRNTEKRQYVWQGVVKNYIPDFIVNGVMTEIKGFKTEQWLAKLNDNPDVKVLYEKDLKHILEYVINKYGKNYTSLYKLEV